MPSKMKTTKTVCERLLHPRSDAACKLGISVRALDHLIAGKQIRTQKIGKRVLIHSKELTKFANANHYEPVASKTNPTATATATSKIVRIDRSA
jgi:hypothetical protein